ncbi:hypothetical protein DEO23_06690 [Brachybacterium endophyticum]|uniref:Uncharacterized protein n=1 Tax=Brachybacterium endophyticum TaxID=2182385 RepID=A0A2U2RL78_9MICO|nr:hypothetical protein [Brachybacterium endophyticum]PWH06629.1 hypothetical protein DEO23_06690 [Brachybacterium endophyticum]
MSDEIVEIITGTLRVLGVGLLLGAGLPLLYSVGIRLLDRGEGGTERDGTVLAPHPVARVAAWLIFAVVALAVVYGLLFITKGSLDHYLGIQLPI